MTAERAHTADPDGQTINPRIPLVAVRFRQPPEATFSTLGALASAASLAVMTFVAAALLIQLIDPGDDIFGALLGGGSGWWGDFVALLRPPQASSGLAPWTWIPFAFTVFGAGLGFVFELGLLMAGTPFQQQRNRNTRFVQRVRLLNLAPVTASIFFFVVCLTVDDPTLRLALLYTSGFAAFALGYALFLGGPNAIVPLILLGAQVVQIVIVLCSDVVVGPGFFIAQAALQLTALVIGTATPLRSTLFHLLSTLSGAALYAGLINATAQYGGGFSHSVAIPLPEGSLLRWGFIVACALGLLFAARVYPFATQTLRRVVSAVVWVPVYFKLVSAPRFQDPPKLGDVYKGKRPAPTPLKAYNEAHPQHLMQELGIPAVDPRDIESDVRALKMNLLASVQKAFKLIAFLDHTLPQVAIDVPLADKPRMTKYSDGADLWPGLFEQTIFGNSLPDGGKLAAAPKPAVDAYREGQLLAYLTESGVANPFARLVPERGPGALVSDFRFLEKYATKPDYAPYGGVAFFRVDRARARLRLEAVIAPGSDREIAADPDDPAFRQAESQILASMYYQVISGKHLAEIHMTYNLVEVSMHNAFDARGAWNHPLRTALYLHFFSHELAEELTTEHLIQEGAVFSQIFATTHDAMIEHLEDTYSRFEFGADEDFDARRAAMTMPGEDGADGELLPHACIKWEAEYFDIWMRYATALIDTIYPDDAAVQGDAHLQDFHRGLLEVLVNGLPDRYARFQTRAGVARFTADTIHHAVIRHQVYGTTGIRAALDPRINTTQVPRDSGTPGVDEWRSLAFVAQATGVARFTLLTGESGKDFRYLLDGVDEPLREPMGAIFQTLQDDLQALDRRWTRDEAERAFNYDYFRPVPSALRTGPGY